MHGRKISTLGRLVESPLARVVAYYVLLFAGAALLVELVPQSAALFSGGPQQTAAEINAGIQDVFSGQSPIFAQPTGAPINEVFGMVAAFALMLPVTWIYILTRRRKGFRQSVVQTLVILPIVVAGVVFMVKNSLALAFSLGGIVAAVSFRNTLRDSKDAVYIFLATGVGLAAGIQSVAFAAALSITFNVIILLLWWTDFGWQPVGLEGPPAQRRFERAHAMADRSRAFVSMVDDQILKSLTPDQLDALAERASKRRQRAAGEGGGTKPASRWRLELSLTCDPEAGRRAAEVVLENAVKRWEFVGANPAPGGGERLEYRVRLRKSVPAESLLEQLRTGVGLGLADDGAQLTRLDG